MTGEAGAPAADAGPVGTGALPRLVGSDEESFTGAELRRLTARVRAHNLPAEPGRVALDVAEVVISLALVVLYLWGFGGPVRELLGSDATAFGLGPGLVQGLVLALAVVGGASVALRLGPAGLPAAGVRWWVPTAADRAGLTSPSVVRSVLVGIGAGLVVGGAPAALAGLSPAGIVVDAVLGGAAGLLVVAGAGVLQVTGIASGSLPGRVLDLLLAAVPVAGLGLALWAPAWAAWAVPWSVPAVLAAVGAVALVVWVRGLDRLRAGALRARASAALQASAAVLSLDGGGVSRALGTGPTASRAFGWVPRAARGPVGALVAADAALLLRSPASLAALLALACTGAVAVQVPALSDGIGLWAVLAGVGYAGALAGAGGPRAAGENPRLDALLPLGARTTRAVRAVWPVLSAGVVLLLVAVVGGVGPWLGVAAPAAVVLGAAAIRAAYRGPVQWDVPMIATPAGAFPTGLVLHRIKGPDLALLGTIPLAWAVVTGVTPALVVAQLLAAATAVYRAAR
ncbi:DUF6297 family protein [Promicromonospora sukumoe]|uniref:DUF6297 family protein n=1 Tax=Promicromonospora sukumoe TaxID=88382 RepID=UPI0003673073|nr:DUF6297 family protein [Promicromonospora sukumoe]